MAEDTTRTSTSYDVLFSPIGVSVALCALVFSFFLQESILFFASLTYLILYIGKQLHAEASSESTSTISTKTSDDLSALRKILEQQDHSAKLLIRRDLDLSRANEKLRELDQMKSDFVSVAAHQLRTPLSVVKWSLDMVLAGDLGSLNDEQHTFLVKARSGNARMISLVNDLLLADHIESGAFKPTGLTTDPLALLDDLLLELYPLAARKKVTIAFDHAKKSYTPVVVDPKHLRVVFQNLIDNAIKYTPQTGTVHLAMRDGKPGMLLIVVSDSGIGIPKNFQDRIFSRFFRAPNAVKEVTDGSGLGLYIVKRVIERNGGSIWFESIEGQGTRFYVEVPVDSNAKVV